MSSEVQYAIYSVELSSHIQLPAVNNVSLMTGEPSGWGGKTWVLNRMPAEKAFLWAQMKDPCYRSRVNVFQLEDEPE